MKDYFMTLISIFTILVLTFGCSEESNQNDPTAPVPTNTPQITPTTTPTETPIATPTETPTATPTETPSEYMQFQYGVYPSSGYTDTKDALIDESLLNDDDNFGGYIRAIVGKTSSTERRILVKFEISGAGLLPANATVTGASLRLYRYSTQCSPSCPSEGQDVAGYRITADWTEGTSSDSNGTLCSGDCVTWNQRTTVNWTTDGGDISDKITPDYNLASGGSSEHYYEIDAATVQDWLDNPGTNYGMLIKLKPEETETGQTVWYYTKEYTTASQRPLLTVYYTVP